MLMLSKCHTVVKTNLMIEYASKCDFERHGSTEGVTVSDNAWQCCTTTDVSWIITAADVAAVAIATASDADN